MTTIDRAGRPQKDIRVQIGADNYEKQVSNIHFPSPSTKTWRGGTPDAKLSATNDDDVCNITLIQAWDEPDSAVRFFLEHAGEDAVVRYKPHADDDFEVEATITIIRPQIGGPVNEYNEATIACPSTPPVPVVVTP